MVHSKDLCTHCAHLSIRQMLLDWVPVIAMVIESVLRFVR